jgi:outer membrane protein TolC
VWWPAATASAPAPSWTHRAGAAKLETGGTGSIASAFQFGSRLALAATLAAAPLRAQNLILPTSSAANPLYGSVATAPVTATPIQLTLNDAVSRGLRHNLALLTQQQNQRIASGNTLSTFNALLPNLTAQAQTGTLSVDLASEGIKPALLSQLGFSPGAIPNILKVNTTSAQLNLSQQLFNLPAIELYRAARVNIHVEDLNTLNTRGNVVLLVSTAYLQTLAAASQAQDQQALLRADDIALQQAQQRHAAGVATNLDELRARVQYQNQQQAVVKAQNAFAEDRIALSRMIGLAADQPIELTDTAPYADLALMPLADAVQLAHAHRKDYLALQAQLRSAELDRKAAQFERVPTLSVGGYYGVLGVTGGLYHGDFVASGTLNVPLFHEAKFRGDREVADAQLATLRARLADLEVAMESQLRASLLDVQATQQLVTVATSNLDLARQELSDSTDRFAAGVDDNLPVVQSQATLAAAQTQRVNALFQYNQAKLHLARNAGVVETQYQAYLGR